MVLCKPGLASSQAIASSHKDRAQSQYRGLAQPLWELAIACDEAEAGLHVKVPPEESSSPAALYRKPLHQGIEVNRQPRQRLTGRRGLLGTGR